MTAPTAVTLAAAKKVIEKEARVVVVLSNGSGNRSDRDDAAALKTRIGRLKRKDVVVVPLDNAPIPGWLKGRWSARPARR